MAYFALDYEWEYLIWTLIDMKMSAERRSKKIKAVINPNLMLISQAHQPRSISTSIAFQRSGVKTLVPHATLPYEQGLYYDYHSAVVTTGKFQQRALSDLGVEPDRLYLTNEGRYDTEAPKRVGQPLPEIEAKLKVEYELDRDCVIAVFTRNIQKRTGLFPKDDVKLSMAQTYYFLCSCNRLSGSFTNCNIIFKSHPLRDYYELYEEFAQNEGVFHIRHEPAEAILAISDSVLFVGPLTDVIFSAAVREKAVVLCDCGLDPHLLEVLKRGVRIVDKPEDIEKTMAWVLQNLKAERARSRNVVKDFECAENTDFVKLLQAC